jgi:hypothetical protein
MRVAGQEVEVDSVAGKPVDVESVVIASSHNSEVVV